MVATYPSVGVLKSRRYALLLRQPLTEEVWYDMALQERLVFPTKKTGTQWAQLSIHAYFR